eukprot:s1515_g9.t1
MYPCNPSDSTSFGLASGAERVGRASKKLQQASTLLPWAPEISQDMTSKGPMLLTHVRVRLIFLALILHISKGQLPGEGGDAEALLKGDSDLQLPQQDRGDEPLLLLATFMILRAAVALRSLQENSQALMWQGIAFACFTRCIAGRGLLGADAAAVLLTGLREFLHVYGLRTALRQLSPGCS